MYYNEKSKLWKIMNHILPEFLTSFFFFFSFCAAKFSWQLRCLKQWNKSTELWDGWLISS